VQGPRIALAAFGGVFLVLVLMLTLLVGGGGDTPEGGRGGVVCAPPGGAPGDPVAGFADTQLANAAMIVATGVEMGIPLRGQVIAVATAMQESNLKNYANAGAPESLALPHEAVGADHDSVGLFQQRAVGWGTTVERMDPKTSARLFYEALVKVAGWETMPLTQAAQSVQIGAFPDAYTKWEDEASTVVGSIAGITCTTTGVDLPANPAARDVIVRAMSQIGVPYMWGGGDANGPTGGGFDCSGLMVYGFAGIGITVPHQTQAIWNTFQPAITDPGITQPGDMLLFSSNGQPSGIHHVGLYLGEGKMLHAPETGSAVQVIDGVWTTPYWTGQFIGAVRPLPAAPPAA
jgi:hypothetical protein